MAILDQNLVFSSAQSLAVTTSTPSTNVIDLSGGTNFQWGPNSTTNGGSLPFGEDLGIGDGEAMPKVIAYIGTALTTTNSATLNIQFQGSTDSSNWTTYVETGTLAASLLTAGAKVAAFDWPHRQIAAALPRYVRLNYAVATGVFTTGTISAYIGLQRFDWPLGLYPAGFTVGT